MPVLPEGSFLSIVLWEVEGCKWFSKVLNILALLGFFGESSKPLELLPKCPLVVDIAVVQEKYWVVSCCSHCAHVTAYADMNIIMWITDFTYETRIIFLHKCLPRHSFQLILVYLDIGASADEPRRWALRIDPLLYWGIYL